MILFQYSRSCIRRGTTTIFDRYLLSLCFLGDLSLVTRCATFTKVVYPLLDFVTFWKLFWSKPLELPHLTLAEAVSGFLAPHAWVAQIFRPVE